MDQKQTVNLFLAAVLAIILLAIFKEAKAADVRTFDKVYQAWETNSTEGCELDGQFYKVGEIEAMNKADLEDFKQMSGYRASDGYAVMMMCTYNVDPAANDHPAVNERTYSWVAFSWYW